MKRAFLDKNNGKLVVEGAAVPKFYSHFSGEADGFHTAGEKDFRLIIESEDLANDLVAAGWNVKQKGEDGDENKYLYIKVKVKFNFGKPVIVKHLGNKLITLDENTCSEIDRVSIEPESIDLVLSPYHWTVNGKNGITAYLEEMHFRQVQGYFHDKYAQDETEPF